MSKKSANEKEFKKKLNVWSLISCVLPISLIVAILLPWSSMFVMRDDALSPMFIRWYFALGTGLAMIVTGILGVIRNKTKAGKFKGSWLGIVGIVVGALIFLPSAYFLGDYLIYILQNTGVAN